MAWTTPRTWVTGEIVQATDLNIEIRDNLNWLHGRIQAGTVTITPSASDTPTSVTVTFPVPFPSVPRVVISPASASVGNGSGQIRGCGADTETTTTFRATVTRGNTTATNLRWIAMVF